MSIDERLFSIVRRAIPDLSINIDDSLSPERCPTWDSVASITLMFLVEDEFGVHFPGNSFLDFPDIGALKTYLECVAT